MGLWGRVRRFLEPSRELVLFGQRVESRLATLDSDDAEAMMRRWLGDPDKYLWKPALSPQELPPLLSRLPESIRALLAEHESVQEQFGDVCLSRASVATVPEDPRLVRIGNAGDSDILVAPDGRITHWYWGTPFEDSDHFESLFHFLLDSASLIHDDVARDLGVDPVS